MNWSLRGGRNTFLYWALCSTINLAVCSRIEFLSLTVFQPINLYFYFFFTTLNFLIQVFCWIRGLCCFLHLFRLIYSGLCIVRNSWTFPQKLLLLLLFNHFGWFGSNWWCQNHRVYICHWFLLITWKDLVRFLALC